MLVHKLDHAGAQRSRLREPGEVLTLLSGFAEVAIVGPLMGFVPGRAGQPHRRTVDGAIAPATVRRWAWARAGRAAAGAGVRDGAGGNRGGRGPGWTATS